jgi:AcrR family transcriptional regulator
LADVGGAPGAMVGETELTVQLGPLFRKLKPGPGLAAEEVLEDQRQRLHGAMAVLVDEGGWGKVRVRSVARTAGVSTSTFYKHFANTDACFASAFDAAMTEILGRSAAAQRRRRDWRGALRAAVAGVTEQLAGDPRAARMTLLEVFSAGPGARRRIGHAVTELERLVAGSFQTASSPVPAPRHLVAGMTAGMMRVARTTIASGRADELPDLADELSGWMLSLPHLEIVSLLRGRGEAGQGRREAKPFPTVVAASSCATADERERLLRATARLAANEGVAALTAPRVRAEAGVSRRRFDAHFAALEECFLDSVETVARDSVGRAGEWAAEADDWTVRVCREVLALCAQAARARPLARLVFLDIFAPGRAGLQRREEMVTRAAVALRETAPEGRRPSPLAAEASVAAAWHIAQAEVAAGRARQLPAIAPLLSYVVLAPMVGPESAASAIREAAA